MQEIFEQQWLVTRAGLLEQKTGYFIEAADLGMRLYDGLTPLWIGQMSRKGWVDLDAFHKKFRQAVAVHSGRFNPLPEGWQQRAADVIAEAKQARITHGKVKQQLRENRGADCTYGDDDDSYTLEEYVAAAYQIGADPFGIAEGADAIRRSIDNPELS